MATEILNLEVKSNIKAATTDTDKLGKSIESAVKETKDLGDGLDDAGKKGKKGLQKIEGGFKGLMKAAGIIWLLNKAFEVFKEVLGKNQKVVDFFSIAMNTLSIAFNDLFKFLENNVGSVIDWFKEIFEDPKQSLIDFGTAIKENLIERFMSLLDVFGFLGKALKELMDGEFGNAWDAVKEAGKEMVDVYTGVDDSVDKLKETFTEGVDAIKTYAKATVEQATALKDAEKAAGRAAVQFAKLNAQYLKEAEDQRQIRDNVNLTFEERIAANEELSKVLEKQQKLQKASVQTQIDYLQAQYNINASEENFIALGNAEVEMLSLQEAINGQLSEQKTNQIGLENELREAKSQSFLEGIRGTERELAELDAAYLLKLDMARKAGVKSVEITKQYEIERQKIIKDAADAKKAITDKETADEKTLADAKLAMEIGMANQGLEIIKDAAGEGTAIAKAAAIAQATMSGIQGVQNAFTSANANIGATAGTFGAYPVTMAAIAGVFAAANVAKIASGSPVGTTVPDTDTSIPAPQMMSGAFQLEGGQAPEPMQAYVVSDDITNNQNKLAIIRRRATI